MSRCIARFRLSTDIRWEAWTRQAVGVLILDEMRGVYERGDVYLKPGDVVIDLGANVGTFTRFALSRGASKVVAFEAEPSHVGFLLEAFAKEIATGQVVVIPKAAWKETTTLRFSTAGVDSQVIDEGGIEVAATTVDQVVLHELGLNKVDFIKADIEGAERHAMTGAAEVLAKFAPRMALCIYHLDDDPTEIPRVVKQYCSRYRLFNNKAGTQTFFSPVN